MPSALGYGLMGGAAAGLDKMSQQVEMQQAEARQEAKTERLRAAQMRDQEVIAEIRAHYEGVKDERKHEQAKELKGMEVEAAEARFQAAEGGRNARHQERIAAGGKGTAYKPQWFSHKDGGGKWVSPGEDPGEGYRPGNAPKGSDSEASFDKLRESAAKTVNKMSPSELKRELERRSIMVDESDKAKRTLVDAITMEQNATLGYRPQAKSTEAPAQQPTDAPPVPGARKAPDGKWYVHQGGKWNLVEM